ncbi:MAG: 2-succinyl-5-enolpyruvyl-6-hydroxy-3-cyclohexene-1-carboxylic-acid synthase [Desulfobacteraceae bacterium]|nr:2-succinyl-5-enolpyruvyl-6-hydroxy-3-cyclohexene-1-carboxylic-acid synthase [Desulfobacteraceae bacterium]
MSRPETEGELNARWADVIIDELVRNGVGVFYISPGNRNVPLIAALTREPRARIRLAVDERGGAYCALGHARATGRPAAVVCTSGTALANYLPAVIEAHRDELPLIVLSADRPPELIDSDANQTIRQVGVFGGFCRMLLDLPCPSAPYPTHALRMKLDQAAAIFDGPVHVNCPFREPLLPPPGAEPRPRGPSAASRPAAAGPQTLFTPVEAVPTDLGAVLDTLRAASRGLVVIGRVDPRDDATAVGPVAAALGWPIYCDVGASLRGRLPGTGRLFSLDHPEALRLVRVYNPRTILQLGTGLVSKNYYGRLLDRERRTLVVVSPRQGYRDPSHQAALRVRATIRGFCRALDLSGLAPSDAGPAEELLAAMDRLWAAIQAATPAEVLSFPAIARILWQALPDGEGLFLGNSLTIRVFNQLRVTGPKDVRVITNRGVSGIEGQIATAVGFAEAAGRRVTAVLGDVSLLHDLNSLLLAKASAAPVVIVVVNNQGGRIFDRLPVARHPEIATPWVTTPHAMHFADVARQFGLPYGLATTPGELTAGYEAALAGGQSRLLEVALAPETDLTIFHQIQAVRLTPPT